jgi:hypothetical protein
MIIDSIGEVGRIMAPTVIALMNNVNLHPIIMFSIVLVILGTFPVLPLE